MTYLRALCFLFLMLIFTACTTPEEDFSTQAAFPDVIALPDGYRPEGVVTGYGPTLYAGSLANGSIYQVNLRTGMGELIVGPQDERIAVGLAFDMRTGYIFAAGGPGGEVYVYDSGTGETVATYALSPGGFVNDVIITQDAAYLTDSFAPVLYKLPLTPRGSLPDPSEVETLTLSGDFVSVPGAFNSNGIEATADGDALIIVNSTRGELYHVDPSTGAANLINLNGYSVTSGDGILLAGQTLYVVRNSLNLIAAIQLSPDLSSGTVLKEIENNNFDVPTTLAKFGSSLYAVNARFGTPPTPTTDYAVVRVGK